MAKNLSLKHFSNPAMLKAIKPELLMGLLRKYQDFFAQRQFDLSAHGEFDFDRLADTLMSPDETTPEALLDALFFIDEMSLPQYFDELSQKAGNIGIDLNTLTDATPIDLALAIWQRNPDALESLHAEKFLTKPKKFDAFMAISTIIPPLAKPTDRTITTIEADLNNWFDTKKRGRGTKVFCFVRDGLLWLLVRHGEPYKREGTLINGESTSIFYRPEKFDVLVYNPQIGEFSIHAATKGEKKAYCKFFGKHIFGSENMFDVEHAGDKYTLEPLRTDGAGSLICTDINGIEKISLCELQFRHDSSIDHVESHRAADVFDAMEAEGQCIPDDVKLVKASFKITFKNAERPRTVTIRPPSTAIYDRESDSELVNTWLEKRGFVKVWRNKADGQPKTFVEAA